MDKSEKHILTQFIAAALSSGKSWEKAVHHATYAYCEMERSIDYIENCPRD
jgi:hypothetical protein